MTDIEANLHWACQALENLNGPAFPSVRAARMVLNRRGLSPAQWRAEVREAAQRIVDGTRHLDGVPAIRALQRSLAA